MVNGLLPRSKQCVRACIKIYIGLYVDISVMHTLSTFSVRGTDSSTSSMRIPPSPRWSCLSRSRNSPFLSRTLRVGRNKYLSPSTTSILGLFISAYGNPNRENVTVGIHVHFVFSDILNALT